MEDQSEIIMQAGIKMLLLFYYFLEFFKKKKKAHQCKDKNTNEQQNNWSHLNLGIL